MNQFEGLPKEKSQSSVESKKEKTMEEYMGQVKFRFEKGNPVFQWENKETETRRNDILILKLFDQDIVGLLMAYDGDISKSVMSMWFSREITPHGKKSYIFDVYRYIIEKDKIENLLEKARIDRIHTDRKTAFIADAYNYIVKNQ